MAESAHYRVPLQCRMGPPDQPLRPFSNSGCASRGRAHSCRTTDCHGFGKGYKRSIGKYTGIISLLIGPCVSQGLTMARALVLLLVALTASSVLAEKTSLPLTPESIAEGASHGRWIATQVIAATGFQA